MPGYMSVMTDFQRDQVADREFGRANAPPESYFIALSTTTPSEDGTNFTEPLNGTGYARAFIPNDKTVGFGPAEYGIVSNIIETSFPDSTSPQGTVTHWGIFDAPVGGNLLYIGELAEQISIVTNSRIFVDVGALQFEVGNLPAIPIV